MASTGTASRIGGAALAALVNGGLVAALLWGLGAPIMRIVERPIEVFDIMPPPSEPPRTIPPPPRPSETRADRRSASGREGAAAPANIAGRASEIVAPPPLVRLPSPPPIMAAPMPDDGAGASSGAARVRGPGTGAGGVGNGRGAGTGGDGTGGGGWSDNSPPRLLRELRPSDYPKAAAQAGIGGTVGVIYAIDTRGRAIDCRITRSSGDHRLDIDTCLLIEKRYRYDPSRDPAGRPVASRIEHDMIWNMEMLPPEPNGG